MYLAPVQFAKSVIQAFLGRRQDLHCHRHERWLLACKTVRKSSYLCTFHTPWGRKRFMRMPFGISSASEVMQKRNEQTFSDIAGVHIIADDMIIAASDEIEHDEIVRKVMQRARDKNIRFNKGKVQFKVSSVTYMGHIAGADGLSVDPAKVEAIVGMPKPACKADLQRLLGMVRYLAGYIPNESHYSTTANAAEAGCGMGLESRA